VSHPYEASGGTGPPPSPLDFEVVTRSVGPPPPPRPDVLDSQAPVDFDREQRTERQRVARRQQAHRRRALVAGAVGGLAALLIGAIVGGGFRAAARPARDGIRPAPDAVGTFEASSPSEGPRPPHDPRNAPASGIVLAPGGALLASAAAARDDRGDAAPSSASGSDRTVRRRPASHGDARNLPSEPTRAQVRRAMEAVRSAVAACAAGLPGIAEVHVTVAGDGRVRHAQLRGHFAGRPEGSCMARAVRTARFPEFRQEPFKVAYPYRLEGRPDPVD